MVGIITASRIRCDAFKESQDADSLLNRWKGSLVRKLPLGTCFEPLIKNKNVSYALIYVVSDFSPSEICLTSAVLLYYSHYVPYLILCSAICACVSTNMYLSKKNTLCTKGTELNLLMFHKSNIIDFIE